MSEEPVPPPPAPAQRKRSSFLGRASSVFHGRRRSSIGSLGVPRVARYEDHFSLQAPTSVVKFKDRKGAARVIYNEDSQLVLEETRDASGKTHVRIKQMQEEGSGALHALRLTYTLVGCFFMGFLLVFALNVVLFLLLDLAIQMGLDTQGKSEPHFGYGFGFLLALPLMIHSFALVMMFAGFFVLDLWKGHYLFRKFVFPRMRDEVVEWLFLLGLLLGPLTVMGVLLITQQADWWRGTSLYWFASLFFFYALFAGSMLWYEARIFILFVGDSNMMLNFRSVWTRAAQCIWLRQKHTLSGYSKTSYASFGAPDTALDSTQARKYLVPGTLKEHSRSLYSRFTQLSCLQGILYETLETPQRLLSVDDITARRPYITSYSWGLEKHFFRPRKTRYIGILRGPGAITSPQLLSTMICSLVGIGMIVFLLVATLVYMGMGTTVVVLVAIILPIICCFPCLLSPIKLRRELNKLRLLKQEHALSEAAHSSVKDQNDEEQAKEDPSSLRNNYDQTSVRNNLPKINEGDEEAKASTASEPEEFYDTVMVTDEQTGEVQLSPKSSTFKSQNVSTLSVDTTKETKPPEGPLNWTGFSKNNADPSMGVFHVSEKYRVTQPTKGLAFTLSLLLVGCLFVWPTLSLFWVESWQLALLYFGLAFISVVRRYTNAEVLLQEMGELCTLADQLDDRSPSSPTVAHQWESQSRISQVAATLSRGRAYRMWRGVFWVWASLLLVFVLQSTTATLDSRWDAKLTFTNNFYYPEQESMHYTACDVNGVYKHSIYNPAVELSDYIFLSAQAYRPQNVTRNDLQNWYGELAPYILPRPDIVHQFRSAKNDVIPVYYKLFTARVNNQSYAILSIRGTHNTWDIFADGQLWGAAALMQVVRATLPFGTMWDPIMDEMVYMLTAMQSGTIARKSFYKSTTPFVEYLKESGNYTHILITGHSLGGGIGMITGAQTDIQAVAISGPNSMLSRHRFGITAEKLEQYTFNVKPDRDPVAMIDEPTKNLQKIECRAPQNSINGCHDVARSLCEVLHTCGTGRRPALCECVTKFGYEEPLPKPNTTVSFAEACEAAAASNDASMSGG